MALQGEPSSLGFDALGFLRPARLLHHHMMNNVRLMWVTARRLLALPLLICKEVESCSNDAPGCPQVEWRLEHFQDVECMPIIGIC